MFPTTRWSCVLALQDDDEGVRLRALNELLQAYRPALLRFLTTAERLSTDQAEDLVQSFMAERMVRGELLRQADGSKGRLRSFLIRSFQNFVADARRKDRALKRMPTGGPLLALEDAPEQAVAGFDESLDAVWARQTLALALDRFRSDCAHNGRAAWWDVFEARVLAPAFGDIPALSFEELATKHGFIKPQDAANALVSAKRAFARVLRAVVADTVAEPQQVDEELHNLRAALARKSGPQS